jgi:exodeoxyribonuclease-1
MTFYFYDLETSSGSSRGGRIMQFAGQRTNDLLEPIGEPDNILVKLADDVVPEPDAILVHGITPQKANEEGISEAELAEYFQDKIALPDTVFVGYNNIRFDDEFMRQVFYRTFYDPYEWHWKDGRGRWDLMDPIRMMRALRPEGLKWPFLDEKPTVKLELMAKENGIIHANAHDALSDVEALIELARRFKASQPRLFEYLLTTKDKKQVAKIVQSGEPVVYTSGKYDSDYLKTTVVLSLFSHPRRDGAIVYDLRHDPSEWLGMSVAQLVEHWTVRYGDEKKPLPVKTMQFNRCPAVAPSSVLDSESKKRIGYDENFAKHQELLAANPAFVEKLKQALDSIEHEQQARLPLSEDVDGQLYDGFWQDSDRSELTSIRHTSPTEFAELQLKIKNKRLREMMPLYKARNFPKLLTPEEHEYWETRRRNILLTGGEKSVINRVAARMQTIMNTRTLSENDKYLLSELDLYIQSIIPEME